MNRRAVALFLGIVAAAAAAPPESRPLAPRSIGTGATRFRLMPPEETGIRTANPHTDPRMWGSLFQEYTVGAIGTGVAVGDYDGDGRPDLYVVSKLQGGRLFRNLGGWRFEDVTAASGTGGEPGVWMQGATWADVNNDGRPDLYVGRFRAPNLLFINQGDGTFREEAGPRGLALVDATGMGAFADFDRDGWLDVYVQTNLLDAAQRPGGQPDRLFRNNGDGTFSDVSARAGIAGDTQGHSVIWWDFDEDGWPDLYVANDFAAPDRLYRNNGDGTFTDVIASAVPHVPYSAMGADLGDADNDGRLDLLVAEMAATTPGKDRRGVAEARARSRDPATRPDEVPQVLRNTLFLGTGTGRLREVAGLAGLAATDWTWAVRWADFDLDGREDLFVTNGMVRELHNTDLLARQMAAESPGERIRMVQASPVLAEANLAFRNLGDLRFESVGAQWGLDQVGVSYGAATGDFDGDGDLDLVFTNHDSGVTVLRNDTTEGQAFVVELRAAEGNPQAVGATVRIETDAGVQVRTLTLARGYLSSSEPLLHFGLGAETLVRRLVVNWPSGRVQEHRGLAAGARHLIREDPALPRAARSPAPAPQFREVSRELGLAVATRPELADETARQRLIPRRHHVRGPRVAAADLDGDGAADLVFGGTPGTGREVRRRMAPAGFRGEPGPPGGPDRVSDGPVLVFEANGDGRPDLLVTRAGAGVSGDAREYQPQLFLGDGRGGWTAAPDALPALPINTGAIVAADFDRDGRLDLFIGGRLRVGDWPAPARSALLFNRGGRFEDVTASHAPALMEPGLVTAALASDADGDGWLDLVIALEWGAVRFLRNNGGRFEDRTDAAGFGAAGTGWWSALATADFNGDGRPDYAAGNVGLNTPYEASVERPALLFHGRFGAGPPETIEARYDGGRLVPWRTRRDLGAVIGRGLRRFPTNDAFAAASLEEIVGADALGEAKRYAATQFASGVFLSQPDGRWRFVPLPRIAQIAPVTSLVAGDLDGDGWADLAAGQNSHAPVPSVGRFEGGVGQLLRGDGRGGFGAVPPAESGLGIPGESVALVQADLDGDGWPDLVATRGAEPALAFKNGGVAGRRMIRVVLRGGPENPWAIGARISLWPETGGRGAVEVLAGSAAGQSEPAVFIPADATAIRVRWPDGAESEHAVAPDVSGVLVIPDPRRPGP